MATYNAGQYLREAIESILNQSFTEFEFLIVDAGSTDDTIQIINSFNDSRIHIIYKKDGWNFVDSLNLGLSQAKGKYIARMDADDISYACRLQAQYNFLEENPGVGACSSWMELCGNRNEVLKMPVFHESIYLGFLISNCFGHAPSMIRRSILTDNHISYSNNFPAAEDYFLWLNVVIYTRLHTLPIVLYKYRKHDEQVTVKRINERANSASKARNFHFEEILSQFDLKSEYKLYPTDQNEGMPLDYLEVLLRKLIVKNRQSGKFNTILFERTVLTIFKLHLKRDNRSFIRKFVLLISFMKSDIFRHLLWTFKTLIALVYFSCSRSPN
jgi:glycosyltransferase involved in cell wall biosynthesis